MVNSMLRLLNIEFAKSRIKRRDFKSLNNHINDVLVVFKYSKSNTFGFKA